MDTEPDQSQELNYYA